MTPPATNGGRGLLFSVVICTRDRVAELESAVSSACRQHFPVDRYEVLVVDNGTGLETERQVAHWARRFQHLRYCREPEAGLARARNRGWRETHGRYVAYTDDDCRLPSDWLVRAATIVEQMEPVVFGGSYVAWYRDGKPAWFRDTYGSRSYGRKAGVLEPCQGNLSGGNIFFSRRDLAALGGFDEDLGMRAETVGYGEESEVQERLRKQGVQPYYDPGLVVEHLVREEKMSPHWAFRAAFAKGVCHRRAFGHGTEVLGRPRLALEMLRTSLALLFDLLTGPALRDRQRFPYAQNYMWEHSSGYFRRLGRLWSDWRATAGSSLEKPAGTLDGESSS